MCMFIAPWPLVGRDVLVRAFRPADAASSEAPFRTLRRHAWATPGVRVVTRAAGRAAGRVTVFSALNVEAARLARSDETAAALRVAKAAAMLERGHNFRQLVNLLSGLAHDEVGALLAGDVPDASSALWTTLRAIARDTERVRAATTARDSLPEIVAGRISELREATVVLLGSNGYTSLLPRRLARSVHRERPGDPIAIVTDWLENGSALAYALPALDLDEAATAAPFDPYARDSRALALTPEDVRKLSATPKPLRVLVPVTIEG